MLDFAWTVSFYIVTEYHDGVQQGGGLPSLRVPSLLWWRVGAVSHRGGAHGGNVCMLSHCALSCWCNLFVLRQNLLFQSSRMANHNQNSYICTPCEEAYLIRRRVSEVKSFHHPIASSWQGPSAKKESCPCSVIPAPDGLLSQRRLCLPWLCCLPGPGVCMHRAAMLEMWTAQSSSKSVLHGSLQAPDLTFSPCPSWRNGNVWGARAQRVSPWIPPSMSECERTEVLMHGFEAERQIESQGKWWKMVCKGECQKCLWIFLFLPEFQDVCVAL